MQISMFGAGELAVIGNDVVNCGLFWLSGKRIFGCGCGGVVVGAVRER